MPIPTLPVIGFSALVLAATKVCNIAEKHDNTFKERMTAAEYQQLQFACAALKLLLGLIPFGG